jgi:hypothetical protein
MTTVAGVGVLFGGRCHDVCDPQTGTRTKTRTPRLQGPLSARTGSQTTTITEPDPGTRLAKEVGSARLPGILRMAAANIATTMSAERERSFAAGAYLTQSARIHNRVATGGLDWTADRQVVLPDPDAVGLLAAMRNGNLS